MCSRILKEELELSEFQKEVLVGMILGDGCLEHRGNSTGAILKVCQSFKQHEFVEWLYEVFKNFVQTPPRQRAKLRNGKQNYEIRFDTLTHHTIKTFYDLFYIERKKIIPESIESLLTPTAFAVWFMGDGSIKSKECRGRILNTQSFTRTDIERLMNILENKFNLKVSIRTQKDGLQIYISAKSASILNVLLRDRIIPYFYYKLPLKS